MQLLDTIKILKNENNYLAYNLIGCEVIIFRLSRTTLIFADMLLNYLIALLRLP
jgi:hypothetical protein